MTTFPSNLQLRDSEREAEEGCSIQSQSTQISSQSAEEITETTAGPSVAGNQSVQPSLSHQRITTPIPPEASINSPQPPQALYQIECVHSFLAGRLQKMDQQSVKERPFESTKNQLVQFSSRPVHLLDKALVVDKNISEMSSVDVEVVMVAAVKIAGKFELGPEYENRMWDRLKSVVCNPKLQWQEDKINQWESQLLEFFDFAISRKHLLHFLHIFGY
ncbi:unnamed protein product, partial [Mesorhabditis belari]|uniref:Uncharacterized protein n=1 Tax=Mesorhabditis belari TaxID=2138241 RepID=A0AAF3JAL1_9BILA